MAKKTETSTDDQYYLLTAETEDMKLLYEFIYGNKRHEIGILLRRLLRLYKETKDLGKKESVRISLVVAYRAYKDVLKERERRFEQRTNRTLSTEIQNAKKGNDASLLRLIEFDKSFLFDSFTQERVLKAEAEEDYNFLEALGESIERKSGVIDKSPGKQNKELKQLRELVRRIKISGKDFNDWKSIYQLLDEKDMMGADGGYATEGAFKRALDRMGVLEG